jgi:hypothetical protein
VPPVPGVIAPIWRAKRGQCNTRKGNNPRRLFAAVETRHLINVAQLLNEQEAQMSANQSLEEKSIYSSDDIFLNCDRLENTRSVIAFLAAAACGILEREEPVSPNAIFGLFLTHQWVQETIESVENFLRQKEEVRS